jgi:hypothetical protein
LDDLDLRNSYLVRLYRRIVITVRIIRALFGKKRIYGTVTVRGNEEFISATIKALELLKEKTPEAHELVQKHIGDIVSGKPSGVFPDILWLGPTFVIMGPAYSEGSTIEYAGAIAHEAYHCELYTQGENDNPSNAVPPNTYSGEHAERLCLQYQCAVLRKLGLDEENIKEYESGLHTRWWEVPFERRDW